MLKYFSNRFRRWMTCSSIRPISSIRKIGKTATLPFRGFRNVQTWIKHRGGGLKYTLLHLSYPKFFFGKNDILKNIKSFLVKKCHFWEKCCDFHKSEQNYLQFFPLPSPSQTLPLTLPHDFWPSSCIGMPSAKKNCWRSNRSRSGRRTPPFESRKGRSFKYFFLSEMNTWNKTKTDSLDQNNIFEFKIVSLMS